MPTLTSVQAAIVSLVVTAGSIAVGFGAFSATTEQIVVSAAGTVVASVFTIVEAFERRTAVLAAK